MLPSNLWQVELAKAFANKRSLALKLVFPLFLAGPVIVAAPPAPVTAGVMALLILFIGVFGAAVGLVNERREGIWGRVLISPLSPRRLLVEQVAANAVVDLLQLAPVLFLFVARYRPAALETGALLACAVSALLTANVLGVLLGTVVSGSGEVHLYAAVLVFLLAALSGLFFPLRAGNAWQVILACLSPFTYLGQSLLAAMGEPTLVAPSVGLIAGPALAFLSLALATLVAPRLLGLP